MKKKHALPLALGLALLVAAPLVAAPTEPAIVKNYGDTLVFVPQVEFEQLVLTVTGPCNYIYRQIVDDGVPKFSLSEETIDGVYTYELVVIPRIDPDIIGVLKDARRSGDNSEVDKLCREGQMPGDPVSQVRGFLVDRGEIVHDVETDEKVFAGDFDMASASVPEKSGPMANMTPAPPSQLNGLDKQLITGDLTVWNSLCVGFDCPHPETFGSDTIRLKENNLRIHFEDTSTLSGFPTTDWRLIANDSASGGANKFSINDATANRTPFTVEGNAPNHSLYVDDGGRVGSGTSTPVVDLHIKDGDTPTLRLEQDNSSGFAPQVWDVAGNETSFFIRDATNGSSLPFRIRPAASSNILVIDSDNDVGVGTLSPATALHVMRSGTAELRVEQSGTATNDAILRLTNNSSAGPNGDSWVFSHRGNNAQFLFNYTGVAGNEFILDSTGNLTIAGNLVTGGGGLCDPGPCDGTFSPAYEVESIEEHAEYMWSNSHLWGVGPTPEGAPINLSKKTTGILHELEKAHIYIDQLNESLKAKDATLAALTARLDMLESRLVGESTD